MKRGRHNRSSLAAAAASTLFAVALVSLAGGAYARPTYFETFKNLYGIGDGDNLDACGVCHFLWTGTGARNPYGTAVEQQLYLGKSITQSLIDVESDDSDGDGFTNVDEIVNFMTLPGYSCDNFHEAIGAPQGYDTYITPFVASCLEPLDIRVAPSQISFLTEVGDVETASLTIFNNGSDQPLSVSSYAFLAGASPSLSVSGPVAPFDIPVGSNVVVDVVFAPTISTFVSGTIRIESNDPDEPSVDVDVTGFGFVRTLAPAPNRARCRASVHKTLGKSLKVALREWGRCYLDEVAGFACDSGARDARLAVSAARLRSRLGGAKDKHCAGAGITPTLLGLPPVCGGTCDSISISAMSDFADCLLCRQDEAIDTYLKEGLGTAPPDLPPNVAGTAAAETCQARVLKGLQKASAKIFKKFGRCRAERVESGAANDCATALATALTKARAKALAQREKCTDTTGLSGCAFAAGADPACLGDAAETIGTTLVDEVFAGED